MKHFYLFLFLITSLISKAQTPCDNANYYLVSAYSHVKSSYDANNISHLKYFANRSVESLKLSKKNLSSCGCEMALELANKAIDLLLKVDAAETYEDGRFFVKQGRELSKQSVIEIDKCAAPNKTVNASNTQTLSDLEKEQLKLQQQQEALKLKEAQLKARMAEEKDKTLELEKEQLMLSYKDAIATNLKTYNETLNMCNCAHTPLEYTENPATVTSKTMEDIKKYYLLNLEMLATKYTQALRLCGK